MCIGEGRGDTHTQLRNILSELPAGNEKKYFRCSPGFGKRKNKLRKKKENMIYFVFVHSKEFEMITDICRTVFFFTNFKCCDLQRTTWFAKEFVSHRTFCLYKL